MGDLGSIPGLGRSPGKGNGNPIQYSCLENAMDRRAYGVAESWTWLSNWATNTYTLYISITKLFIYLKYKFIYFNWRLITLQYCIGFAYINKNPPQVYTCSPSWTPLPPPSPYHPSSQTHLKASTLEHPTTPLLLFLVHNISNTPSSLWCVLFNA